MGNALDRAAMNRSASRRFDDRAPNGTAPCPLIKKLVVGVFFDGTDNNMFRDRRKKTQTNVVRMYEMYEGNAHYEIGVGAADVHGVRARAVEKLDQATGGGGKKRLNRAYDVVEKFVKKMAPDQEKVIDVFGFSRGAALARTFTNLIVQGMARTYPNLRVRFLGLFDTVASFLGNAREAQSLHVAPSSADRIVHIVALNECREKFPLSVIAGKVRECTGAHADIGGGYAPGEGGRDNHLAAIPLSWMHAEALEVGVPLSLSLKNWIVAFGIKDMKALEKLEKKMHEMNIPAGGDIFEEDRYIVKLPLWGSPTVVERPNFPNFTAEQKQFIAQYIHRSHVTGSLSEKLVNSPNSDYRREYESWASRTLWVTPPNFSWSGSYERLGQRAATVGGSLGEVAPGH